MADRLKHKRIGVVGAGIMGRALINGLLQNGVERQQLWAAVRTESSRETAQVALGIPVGTSFQEELATTDLLLLCVKPKAVRKVCQAIAQTGRLSPEALVISIAAGVTLEELEGALGTCNPVIRAMPNTPCQVGAGMTVLSRGTYARDDHLRLGRDVFDGVGRTLELDEAYMDAVTGLSASGPAFIYLIIEALADGGVKVGLPRDVALDLVVNCVLGSAQMVRTTRRHPAALRDEVTTPAGCTISGLLTLEDGKIRSVLARAVEEAATIASRLGK
ncbi:MAG: pyrroline-5-carboxylate reductase [Myxococcota bacterium]|jgi:pyrroline-5-carboxylate reductase|nr:pyrroline-5-carboxylate reductase [Myxococcota bacterium]